MKKGLGLLAILLLLLNTALSESATERTGFTEAVPETYLTASAHPGTVETIVYDTKDYAGDEEDIQKTAYVYLPYGYDENDSEARYNILYLMHGWGGAAGEYFYMGNGYIKTMLDNMIERGDIPPLIAVSATFYTENSSRDFSASIDQFRQFHLDFENALMPAVEGKYHTYAASASDEDLKASRDHRAFGGFSLGSVTTWLEFCYDTDYIHYFLPMSGSCWYYGTYGDFQTQNNVNFIENMVKEQELDERGYFIYFTTGTRDNVRSQSEMQAEEMLSRSDVFPPEHFVFYEKNGGYHDFDAVREYMYNALPFFFREDASEAQQGEAAYTTETRIADVINDPAFDGYGRLIFPVNSGYYSGNTLGDLRLTWYNHIDPAKTVEIANYMRSHALAGDTIFYDIYTEEEKAADPEKRDTGLFFFRGNPGAKFAVCCAGGGHVFVGAMHDSFPHALELSKLGYNAFALIYRPGWTEANEDMARAVSFIFAHADELEVDVDCYSLWGGSAGARISAYVGSHGPAYYGGDDLPKAGTVVMQYTGHSEYQAGDPPTYANCGTSDWIADWQTMQYRLNAMTRLGIPTEFHAYEGLPHGFGLGTGTVAEGWIFDAVAFWETQMERQ